VSVAISVWAGVAVIGFAMVFSVPRRTLPAIVVIAIFAHLVRSLCLDLGAALPAASFLAAIVVGLAAAILAPRRRDAIPIYAFAPVIPLIPGTFLFDALTGLLDLTTAQSPETAAIVDAALVDASVATLTIAALAVGTISPTLLLGHRIARLATRGPGHLDGPLDPTTDREE
jgi:uncharacterized membrane protein YjjB (DUF3815 family)